MAGNSNQSLASRPVRLRVGDTLFLRDVISTFSTQMGVLVLNMVNAIALAQTLGPEGKGLVTLGMVLANTLALVASCGVGVANAYYAASGRVQVQSLVANSLIMGVSTGLVVGGGIFGAIRAGLLEALVPGLPDHLALLSLLMLPAALVNSHFAGILQGLHRISTVNALEFLHSLVILLLLGVLVIGLGLGPVGALLAYVFGGLARTGMFCLVLRRMLHMRMLRLEPRVLLAVLRFGLKGHAGNLLQFMNYRFDFFVLNYFQGQQAVGIYSVSSRVAEMLWLLPRSAAFVILPKAAGTSPMQMNRFTPRVAPMIALATTAAAIFLWLAGEPLISTLFGPAFAPAYMSLLALLPGALLLGCGKILSSDIAGRGYPQYNSVSSGIAFTLTLLLDLVLIPQHGVLGASIASSVAYGMSAASTIIFYRRVSSYVQQERHQSVPNVEH